MSLILRLYAVDSPIGTGRRRLRSRRRGGLGSFFATFLGRLFRGSVAVVGGLRYVLGSVRSCCEGWCNGSSACALSMRISIVVDAVYLFERARFLACLYDENEGFQKVT